MRRVYGHKRPAQVLGLAVLFVTTLFWGCEEPATDDGVLHTIAFQAKMDGHEDWDVFLISEDGTELRSVPGTDSDEIQPRFHPETMLVYFLSDRGDGEHDLFYTDSLAQNVTQVTDGFNIRSYAFSPNGGWITFQTWSGSNYLVYRIREDGSSAEQLIQDAGSPIYKDSGTIWYSNFVDSGKLYSYTLSDGDTQALTAALLTVTVADATKNRDVFLVQYHLNLGQSTWQMVDDGGNAIITLDVSQSQSYGPVHLSDDGKIIAWSEFSGGATQIMTSDRELKGIEILTEGDFYKSNPEFYHEDFRIMYMGKDNASTAHYLYTVPAAGGEITRITQDFHDMDEGFAISPDFWQE